jgi:hypothetical protein
MSGSVQVFGRRDDEPLHVLRWPASEKRQGTKSRSVTGSGCRGRYGDFAGGLGLLWLERGGRRARFSLKGAVSRRWKRVDWTLPDGIDGATAGQSRGPMRAWAPPAASQQE